MPLTDLTPPPTPAPSRSMSNDEFIAAADATVAWWATFVSQMNTLTAELEATAALIAVAPAYADPDLLAIAALSTTTFGRSLLTAVDGPAAHAILALSIGTNVQAWNTNLDALSSAASSSFGRGLLNLANAAALRTAAGVATLAETLDNTSTKLLTADIWWDTLEALALTDGPTITADFGLRRNFTVTLGGNRVLASPPGMKSGQTGCIEITQDGTGSRTLTYDSAWKFANGTAPVLSTAAGAKDLLRYRVLANNTTVFGELTKAIA